jgi:hypothetical protein
LAVRLKMDLFSGGRIRRLDKTEAGSALRVEPIGHVLGVVFVLDGDIPAMEVGDISRGHTAYVVAVHKNWH